MENKIWIPQVGLSVKTVDTEEGQARYRTLTEMLVSGLVDLKAQAYSGVPSDLSEQLRQCGYALIVDFLENPILLSPNFMLFLKLRQFQPDNTPRVELDIEALADSEDAAWACFERAIRRL